MNKNILNIIQSFEVEDRFIEIQSLGGGLINDTLKVVGESWISRKLKFNLYLSNFT